MSVVEVAIWRWNLLPSIASQRLWPAEPPVFDFVSHSLIEFNTKVLVPEPSRGEQEDSGHVVCETVALLLFCRW